MTREELEAAAHEKFVPTDLTVEEEPAFRRGFLAGAEFMREAAAKVEIPECPDEASSSFLDGWYAALVRKAGAIRTLGRAS